MSLFLYKCSLFIPVFQEKTNNSYFICLALEKSQKWILTLSFLKIQQKRSSYWACQSWLFKQTNQKNPISHFVGVCPLQKTELFPDRLEKQPRCFQLHKKVSPCKKQTLPAAGWSHKPSIMCMSLPEPAKLACLYAGQLRQAGDFAESGA